MACMPRFPIIFVMSENYADSRLFEKWTTLAAWQLQQLLWPIICRRHKKQEGGEVGRVVTPCRISYPLFTAEFMSLRGFQRMKIWRAVHILVILVCIDLHDANS